ncbi:MULTISPECIES: hypothetical protein [unclassified Marinobacter]|uniref:hypothetical protein n=1 Tax=unclassified Marinobacter TaxID=83889 RepID=UPI001269443D|nr:MULTISPECIES: hypothetical protein [unclassified Marinobacter]QFS86965.1 hypothetical protein FIV08_08995 [Marinobacter sp. THAF197a]QFT50749.1 hypothetical protein FIU96_08915 [Marinobacter sp. THAF39]
MSIGRDLLRLCIVVLASGFFQAATAEDREQSALTVSGLSASVGDDDPRVLYILPWQNPTLPRRPRAELNSQAPELNQPLSPQVLENHRQFRESLNPLVLKPAVNAAGPGQP